MRITSLRMACAAFMLALVLNAGVVGSAYAETAASLGAADIGAALWAGEKVECRNCHGDSGEGGFGPPLAGRALTQQDIAQAVRHPVGIMPSFTENQISDVDIGHLAVYLARPPFKPESGTWKVAVPDGAPPGQMLAISLGCGQCHGAELRNPRAGMGSGDGSFAWFKDMVYRHTSAFPEAEKNRDGNPGMHLVMGNYAQDHLPEAQLRDIYDWARSEGPRVPLRAVALSGVEGGAAFYRIIVQNRGIKNKGLTAKNIVVTMRLPADAAILRAEGGGYKGLRETDAGKSVSWEIPAMKAGERRALSIRLTSSSAPVEQPPGDVSWQMDSGQKDRGILRAAAHAPYLFLR